MSRRSLYEVNTRARVDPATIRRSPEKHLLYLSFFDLKHLLDIKPVGGVYIYSSNEAHSDARNMRRGDNVVTVLVDRRDRYFPEYPKEYYII